MPAKSKPSEGAAPQKQAQVIKTIAYYVGTSFRNGLRYHTFNKNFSNRGEHGTGDRSPHGRDMEAMYHSPIKGNEIERTFVRGTPYSFIPASVAIADSTRSYLVVSVISSITPSSEIVKTLPFLRGHTTPYRQDPRFVMFNPVLGQDWASPTTSAFKIYADKTKGMGSGEILTQLTTLTYPSGLEYPHILSASSPLSKFSLGDMLPPDFLTSVCIWSKTALLIGTDEHPTIPTITLTDLLTGPSFDTITNPHTLSTFISSFLVSKYRDSPSTPDTEEKRARAQQFTISPHPDHSVLIWAGRVPSFGLPEARKLGKYLAPLICTRIAIAANMVSNFSPSSSFLDLNTDIFHTTETHHLDLIDGSVMVANFVGTPPVLCNRGIGNVRTYVIATLRTTELKPHDNDNNIFPPLNLVTGIVGTTPHHEDDLDSSVNLNMVIVKVQTKKVEGLSLLLGDTRAVKTFGSLAQTRNARWSTISVCPSGTNSEELEKICKLDQVYATTFRSLIVPSTTTKEISIRCQGSKVYSRDTPCHLLVVTAFENSKGENPLSVFPTSDFSIKVSLQDEESVKELIVYLKEANKSITPAIFHSYRTNGVMNSFFARRPQTLSITPTPKSRLHPTAGIIPPKGHFVIVDNLSLMCNVDPWLSTLKDKGINIINTHLVRNTEYEHKLVVQVQDEPSGNPVFSDTMVVNGTLVYVSFLNNIDHLLVVDLIDRKEVLRTFNSFKPSGKESDPMVDSFLKGSVKKLTPSQSSSSSSSSPSLPRPPRTHPSPHPARSPPLSSPLPSLPYPRATPSVPPPQLPNLPQKKKRNRGKKRNITSAPFGKLMKTRKCHFFNENG